jgi:hypothetical protein
MAPDTKVVGPSRLDITSAAIVDAMSRLGEDDLFIPHGFEVLFRVPTEEGSVEIRPDGVRFSDAERTGYYFRENKATFSRKGKSYYEGEQGLLDLYEDVRRQALVVKACSARGCKGYLYTVNEPRLGKLIAKIIRDLGDEEPQLDGLVFIPGYDLRR